MLREGKVHEKQVFLWSPVILLSRTRKIQCAVESNNQHFKPVLGACFGSDFKERKLGMFISSEINRSVLLQLETKRGDT